MHGTPPLPPWIAVIRASGSDDSSTVFVTPGDCVLFTQTDAQGHYKLSVPAGDRTVRAYAQGYVPGEAKVTVVEGSNASADITLTPQDTREFTLTGHVTRKDGDKSIPVSGATVEATEGGWGIGNPTAMDAHPVQLHPTTPDDSGAYKLNLRTGSYCVFASKDLYGSEPVRVDLTKDSTLDLNLSLVVSPPPPPGRGSKR